MSLNRDHSSLLAFGIYARDFRYSSKDDPNASIVVLASGSLLFSSIFFVLLMN